MAPAREDLTEAVGYAREVAKQELGSALGEKATDEFCLSFAAASARSTLAPGVLMTAGLESVAAPAPDQQNAVIELQKPDAEPPTAAASMAEALGKPGVSEQIAATMEGLGEEAGVAEQALALVARQVAIRAGRDRFYRELGSLRDEVERASATLAPSTLRRPRIGNAAAPVQACWLNSTIRADTHASVLGEVAEHGAVQRIDLPRRLEPEVADVTIESAATLRSGRQLGGAGVLVGVIDSEVQLNHPALGGRVVHRRNYTQEPFGTPDSHGTAVAGLIAASQGFVGMAPDAEIYNYKVLATQRALTGTDFEGALAIQHALEDGVRVVNCSWGAGPAGDGSSREADACNTAWRLGLVIVKSAGNNGPGPQTLTTPADAEGVLVVGATTGDGATVPDYSSRGPTRDGRERPHVVAPGGDFDAELDGILVGGQVGVLSGPGTSFAAPHVTGLVALLLQSEPQLTPDEVRDRVVGTCSALANAGPEMQGAGLVTPSAL